MKGATAGARVFGTANAGHARVGGRKKAVRACQGPQRWRPLARGRKGGAWGEGKAGPQRHCEGRLGRTCAVSLEGEKPSLHLRNPPPTHTHTLLHTCTPRRRPQLVQHHRCAAWVPVDGVAGPGGIQQRQRPGALAARTPGESSKWQTQAESNSDTFPARWQREHLGGVKAEVWAIKFQHAKWAIQFQQAVWAIQF
eukprot:48337-Chlamydomonas_euryale.AAC.1